jgi:hypothetical protein
VIRRARRLLGPLILAACAAGVVSYFYPGHRGEAIDALVLFVGGLGLVAAVGATRAASPEVHEPSLAAELEDPLDVLAERPAELEKLERDVYLALGTSFYFHHRVRPTLREIAASRLLARHGVDLDAQPESAEALLGAEAWAVLRPDCVAPEERWSIGPPLEELTAVVDSLERI